MPKSRSEVLVNFIPSRESLVFLEATIASFLGVREFGTGFGSVMILACEKSRSADYAS